MSQGRKSELLTADVSIFDRYSTRELVELYGISRIAVQRIRAKRVGKRERGTVRNCQECGEPFVMVNHKDMVCPECTLDGSFFLEMLKRVDEYNNRLQVELDSQVKFYGASQYTQDELRALIP